MDPNQQRAITFFALSNLDMSPPISPKNSDAVVSPMPLTDVILRSPAATGLRTVRSWYQTVPAFFHPYTKAWEAFAILQTLLPCLWFQQTLRCMFDLLRCYGGFFFQGPPLHKHFAICDTEALWTAAAEANRVNTVRTEWLNTLVSFSSSGNVMDKSRFRSFFSADICLHRLSLPGQITQIWYFLGGVELMDGIPMQSQNWAITAASFLSVFVFLRSSFMKLEINRGLIIKH